MSCLVGVSIVNYKTATLVVDCLAALAEHAQPHVELRVCVVDNLSPDDSVDILTQAIESNRWRSWVELVPAPANGGFSYGNNVAIKYLQTFGCDYFWLLNPDTRAQQGSLNELINYLDQRSDVGVVGSQLIDPDGTTQISAFHYPRPWGEFVNGSSLGIITKSFPRYVIASDLSNTPGSVDWVAGASMLIKKSVIQQVGLMDEEYFLYFEEVDYCKKIQRNGFQIHFVPQSRVVHLVGAATGISDSRKARPRMPGYWFESRRRYFRKNYGIFGAVSADICWLSGHVIRRLKSLLKRTSMSEPPKIFTDFIAYSLINPFRKV